MRQAGEGNVPNCGQLCVVSINDFVSKDDLTQIRVVYVKP